jgi:hypothetical protein
MEANEDRVKIAESLFDNPEVGAVITGHEAATDAKGKRVVKPKVFRVTPFNELMAMIDQAIAEGRHSPDFRTVCPQCREWVDGIFWINPQSARDRCCIHCAARNGNEGAIAELAKRRQRENAQAEYDAIERNNDYDGSGDIPF